MEEKIIGRVVFGSQSYDIIPVPFRLFLDGEEIGAEVRVDEGKIWLSLCHDNPAYELGNAVTYIVTREIESKGVIRR